MAESSDKQGEGSPSLADFTIRSLESRIEELERELAATQAARDVIWRQYEEADTDRHQLRACAPSATRPCKEWCGKPHCTPPNFCFYAKETDPDPTNWPASSIAPSEPDVG